MKILFKTVFLNFLIIINVTNAYAVTNWFVTDIYADSNNEIYFNVFSEELTGDARDGYESCFGIADYYLGNYLQEGATNQALIQEKFSLLMEAKSKNITIKITTTNESSEIIDVGVCEISSSDQISKSQ